VPRWSRPLSRKALRIEETSSFDCCGTLRTGLITKTAKVVYKPMYMLMFLHAHQH